MDNQILHQPAPGAPVNFPADASLTRDLVIAQAPEREAVMSQPP